MVFMDCDMPLMDGFTTTLVIRASTQASIPVIALTANSRARTERAPAELAFETWPASWVTVVDPTRISPQAQFC
jgi:CheY-like chemotaxis protein